MPFVLFLLFGGIFLLVLVNDNGKQISRANNFPLMKNQEEYILAYELLNQYKKDPNRDDPCGDALEDARKQIWESGYLPSTFSHYGMSEWNSRPLTRRANAKFPLGDTPRYSELLYYRKEDERPGGFQSNFIRQVVNDVTVDDAAWEEYCAQIDSRFVKLYEDYNIQRYQTEQNRPLASALEYLVACCKTSRKEYTKWRLWHVRTLILQAGYLPTSLKPRSGNHSVDVCDLYVLEYPPNADRLNKLLAIDAQYWANRGIQGFEEYNSLVNQIYGATLKTKDLDFEKYFNTKALGGILENPHSNAPDGYPNLQWANDRHEWIDPGWKF